MEDDINNSTGTEELFPQRQLPKCAIFQATTSQIWLAAMLGCYWRPNLTFGKLPLGKLSTEEVTLMGKKPNAVFLAPYFRNFQEIFFVCSWTIELAVFLLHKIRLFLNESSGSLRVLKYGWKQCPIPIWKNHSVCHLFLILKWRLFDCVLLSQYKT